MGKSATQRKAADKDKRTAIYVIAWVTLSAFGAAWLAGIVAPAAFGGGLWRLAFLGLTAIIGSAVAFGMLDSAWRKFRKWRVEYHTTAARELRMARKERRTLRRATFILKLVRRYFMRRPLPGRYVLWTGAAAAARLNDVMGTPPPPPPATASRPPHPRRVTPVVVAMLGAAMLSLTGCGKITGGTPPPDVTFTVTVHADTDGQGGSISIRETPKK